MLQDEYKWECPKCGEVKQGQGPASLNWAKTNHEWEHEREEKRLQHNVAMPGVGSIPQPEHDPLMYRGVAILDDAFYDGARLTRFDLSLLKTLKLSWNPAK